MGLKPRKPSQTLVVLLAKPQAGGPRGWPRADHRPAFLVDGKSLERTIEAAWVTVYNGGDSWTLGVDHAHAVPIGEVEGMIRAFFENLDETDDTPGDPFPYDFRAIESPRGAR